MAQCPRLSSPNPGPLHMRFVRFMRGLMVGAREKIRMMILFQERLCISVKLIRLQKWELPQWTLNYLQNSVPDLKGGSVPQGPRKGACQVHQAHGRQAFQDWKHASQEACPSIMFTHVAGFRATGASLRLEKRHRRHHLHRLVRVIRCTKWQTTFIWVWIWELVITTRWKIWKSGAKEMILGPQIMQNFAREDFVGLRWLQGGITSFFVFALCGVLASFLLRNKSWGGWNSTSKMGKSYNWWRAMVVSLVDRRQRSQDYEADETAAIGPAFIVQSGCLRALGDKGDKQIKDKLFRLQLPAAFHKHAAMWKDMEGFLLSLQCSLHFQDNLWTRVSRGHAQPQGRMQKKKKRTQQKDWNFCAVSQLVSAERLGGLSVFFCSSQMTRICFVCVWIASINEHLLSLHVSALSSWLFTRTAQGAPTRHTAIIIHATKELVIWYHLMPARRKMTVKWIGRSSLHMTLNAAESTVDSTCIFVRGMRQGCFQYDAVSSHPNSKWADWFIPIWIYPKKHGIQFETMLLAGQSWCFQ